MMHRMRYRAAIVAAMTTTYLLIACGDGSEVSMADTSRLRGSDTEAKPMRMVMTMEAWDTTRADYTADTNTNQTYRLLDLTPAGRTVQMACAVESIPVGLRAAVMPAVARAAAAWQVASSVPNLISLRPYAGRFAVEYDGVNQLGCGDPADYGLAPNVVAAAFIYYRDGAMLEADLLLSSRADWSVNPPIKPGEARLSVPRYAYDVQALVTNEFGHVLGLDHVTSDGDDQNGDEHDATMCRFVAPGALRQQTLTPGDVAGIRAVTSR